MLGSRLSEARKFGRATWTEDVSSSRYETEVHHVHVGLEANQETGGFQGIHHHSIRIWQPPSASPGQAASMRLPVPEVRAAGNDHQVIDSRKPSMGRPSARCLGPLPSLQATRDLLCDSRSRPGSHPLGQPQITRHLSSRVSNASLEPTDDAEANCSTT